jgi:putative ABC transport system substrate-binding protein
MRRRDFVALLAGAVAPRSFVGPPWRPVVGLLASGSASAAVNVLDGFRRGLADAGYVEGHDVAIEYRWAEGNYERLAGMATELAHRPVTVIAAMSALAVLPARAATTTIPIVFYAGFDPVELGLVASLTHPGGNVTGIRASFEELIPRRLQLLHALAPTATQFGLLLDPKDPGAAGQSRAAREAARRLDVPLLDVNASSEKEIEPAFAALSQKTDGMILGGDPLYSDHRERIVALAAQYKVPTVYYDRQFVDAGGLISYGDSLIDMWRQVGAIVGKILKGAKPADIPVQGSTRFELVVNMKTVKRLDLTVPLPLLARADVVIQ